LTLTSKSSSGLGKAQSKFSAANIATKKFLHHLDTVCWKHSHRRKGHRVACIATVEGLSSWENWHVHLTLCAPDHMNYWEFHDYVLKAAKKVKAFGKQIRIDPYDDPEWIEYCFKTGSDCWLIDCTRQAKP
jgi:hypothetical protein